MWIVDLVPVEVAGWFAGQERQCNIRLTRDSVSGWPIFIVLGAESRTLTFGDVLVLPFKSPMFL
jgi:hypothetical protein